MKKLITLAAITSTMLSGCATYIPMGIIFSGGTTGQSANNNVKPLKTGKSCVLSILGLVAAGGGGIAEAKADGGICNVASVDYEAFNVLGIYGTYCTVVKGE